MLLRGRNEAAASSTTPEKVRRVPKQPRNLIRSKAAAIDHAARRPRHGASPASNATAARLSHSTRPGAGGSTADAAVTRDRRAA